MSGPAKPVLDGVRVLDFTRVMSGPYCTAMLADLGAEVIKVEMPGIGDDARTFAPFEDGVSTYFVLLNRGKKSISVDLKTEEGVGLIREIAKTCDVVVENFRPGVGERLGLDHATLRAEKPDLVYASISGFGRDSPLSQLPAFDLVIQAMSGLMSLTGERDGRALPVGESFADVATGIFAAWGVLAALFERERTGQGRHVEAAMLDSIFSMLLTGLSRELFTDQAARRVGARHPETYPVDSFSASDGDFVLVGFSPRAFEGIMMAIGRPELATDPKFATNAARNENEAELRAIIAEWASARTREQAIEGLAREGVPAGPVCSLGEVLDGSHRYARGLVAEGTNSVLGDIPLVPQPVRFSGMPRPQGQRVPALGEDTEDVLTGLSGLTQGEIADLRKRKVVA